MSDEPQPASRDVPAIGVGLVDDAPPVKTRDGDPEPHHQPRTETTVESPSAVHARQLEGEKHRFARMLIWVMVGAVMVYGVAAFFVHDFVERSAAIAGVVDFFKLIATTALGFVFGRTITASKA